MIHVVAAVIQDADGRVLIARRHDHLHQGGLWEFPGGKHEAGESREQALVRELMEELGIQPTDFRPLIQIPHHYPDKSVLLDVWLVTAWQGQAHGRENQQIQWVSMDELENYEFPAANLPILKACHLPDQYLITPLLQTTEREFLQQLRDSLGHGISMVQYRQKGLPAEDLRILGEKVVGICHEAGCRVVLNSAMELVDDLQADGLHMNASQLMKAMERPLDKDFLVGASCHNVEELQHAAALGLDFAVLSPVSITASHPQSAPLGWQQFQHLASEATLPVYALGGLSPDDLAHAWQSGAQGIAAISALWSSTVSR